MRDHSGFQAENQLLDPLPAPATHTHNLFAAVGTGAGAAMQVKAGTCVWRVQRELSLISPLVSLGDPRGESFWFHGHSHSNGQGRLPHTHTPFPPSPSCLFPDVVERTQLGPNLFSDLRLLSASLWACSSVS